MPVDNHPAAALLMRAFDPVMLSDVVLVAAMLILACIAPRMGMGTQDRLRRFVSSHLNTAGRQMIAVGMLAIVIRAIFLPWLGPPVPQYHDEYSLMLQGQTYVAGRFINPTPDLWQHFEAIHINVVPAYGSMYFPGRGLPLAIGLWLAGNAWIGVWLSFVGLAMATVWMLRGWVSSPLALLGGVLVVLRLGAFSYWVNSYWGGAFTAFGAMLVVGALPRVLARPTWGDGLLLGLGGLILLTTRPYEGALLCVPLAIYLLIVMIRRKDVSVGALLLRVGVPAAIFSAAGGGLLLAHNQAATGDPLTAAYSLNRETYATTPAMLIAPPVVGEQRGPAYFRKFYRWEEADYKQRHDPVAMLMLAVQKLYYAFAFHVGPLLAPAFLAGLWASRSDRILPVTMIIFFAGYLLETWGFAHYTAPILPVLLIFVMRGFAWLADWRFRKGEFGPALARFIPAATALGLLVPAFSVTTGWPSIEPEQSRKPCCALLQDSVRSRLEAQVSAVPGRHVVLVASDGLRLPHVPIVYNEPVIAEARIVWAQDLGADNNDRLLQAFAGRTVWTLEWNEHGDTVLGRLRE